ncbi:MAG TPA: hypothetical protein PLC80_01260 [Draconibacterium sp.]|nr:hypothetical protein [Draconibacterium sp.]
MNEARKKIEDFKKSASPNTMRQIIWDIKITDAEKMDYHARLNAERLAIDDAIAQKLGVTLSDKDTWPTEQAQINAKDWASKLPDK